MPETYTPEELERALACFQKMYDVARIVDPVRGRVIGCMGKAGEICCRYLERAGIRTGCLALCAYRENRSMAKLEYVEGSALLVTAVPVSMARGTVVVELLKNVTDAMLIGQGVYGVGKPLTRAVEEWSDLLSRDVLTGLYNRRFADGRLPAEIARAARQKAPISIIFLDVNGFKSINDACGHGAGDLALRATAASVRRAIDGMDGWAARYGGDEFLVCLLRADEKAACRAAERIRKNVRQQKLRFRGREIRLSVSAGIQSVRGGNLTAGELIARADRNMYMEKRLRKGAQGLRERRPVLKGAAPRATAADADRRRARLFLPFEEWRDGKRPIIKAGGVSERERNRNHL